MSRDDAAARVLLVEDEPRLSALVAARLRQDGHDVVVRADGTEALEAAADQDIDVIVLDIGIPAPDGLKVLEELRSRGDDRPILMLTGRRDVPDRVAGLEAGADDYLTKPFAMDELAARVMVLARRRRRTAQEPITSGDVVLDPASRTITRAGTSVELTAREFDLCALFLRHPNQVLTRDQIYAQVWGWDEAMSSNVVAVYVGYLRDKLDRPHGRSSLRTVRGIGYRWDPER